MDLWNLFIVALMPNLKVLLVTAVGSFLALERFDILGNTARKNLNSLVYYIFLPALLCSSLAKTITLRSLVMMWFMPLSVLLTFFIGAIFGWLLMKMITVPDHLRGLVLGCCAAGNLGNLLIIIVPSLCKEKNSPLGDADLCYKNGLAQASLSMGLVTIYIWTHVYNMIRICSQKFSKQVKVDETMVINTMSITKIDPENISSSSIGESITMEDNSKTKDDVKHIEIECTTIPDGQVEVSRKEKIMKQLNFFAEKMNLKVLTIPSTIATIVGLIIGVVPQFRKLLVGDTAPLRVVQNSIHMLGDACIPAMTLLVGANLNKGLKGFRKLSPIIVGITLVRFIALPIIGIGIVKGATHFGLIHADPLYQFLLLFQFPLPPAVAISTITQLFGVGEGECSVIMLATYSVATISLTIWSTFFLWLVQ